MMRSLYSGVSGLQNHQTRMDVIGNNVANVNTNGYKKGRVTFQDILSQTMTGAAKPDEKKGGINPKQVGLGMAVASIDTIMNQGSLQTTGKNTDLAITGEGFFVTNTGDKTFYTRAGNFMIDREGQLVNPNGMKVQGWNAQMLDSGETIVNKAAPMNDITIPLGEKLEARQTNIVKFKSNLNMNLPVVDENATEADIIKNTHTTSIDVVDQYGEKRRMVVNFRREGLNQWRATASIDGIDDANVQVNIGEQKLDTNNEMLLNFNTNGTLSSITEAAGANQQTDAEENLLATLSYTLPDGTVQNFDMNIGTAGSVKDSITQFSSPTSTKAYEQDGYEMSYLESFKIDSSGSITGTYSNGEKRTIAQLALATFVNPGGLTKQGENLYAQSNNSGLANIGTAGDQGKGKIFAGALEMSNVDLSETFTDMIVTERGFQANSRVITTTDKMLQEVMTLKR